MLARNAYNLPFTPTTTVRLGAVAALTGGVVGVAYYLIWHIRETAVGNNGDVFLVDFSRTAQGCRQYEEYVDRLGSQDASDIEYLGIGIYGQRKQIDKLTKGLSMLGK